MCVLRFFPVLCSFLHFFVLFVFFVLFFVVVLFALCVLFVLFACCLFVCLFWGDWGGQKNNSHYLACRGFGLSKEKPQHKLTSVGERKGYHNMLCLKI